MELIKKYLAYLYNNNIPLITMGDLIEIATRTSVGNSVYTQASPEDQLNTVRDLLIPFVKKGLLLGMHTGNHEERIKKAVGVDITSMICNEFKVPFMGYACWSIIYTGKMSYSMYSLHGTSGSKYTHTKIKSVFDVSNCFDADVVASGHVHDLSATVQISQHVNKKRKVLAQKEKHIVLTGHFLNYTNGYGQMTGMPIPRMGAPVLFFNPETKSVIVDINVPY
jgi:UDP-2,3-diacylglucosamine pyrophosphatase LpxH